MKDKSDINLKAIFFFISSYCIKTRLPEVPENKKNLFPILLRKPFIISKSIQFLQS